MKLQEWINGKFKETETEYKIADIKYFMEI